MSLSEQELKTLCHVYLELNSIRSRCGSPTGVDEEWWSDLTDRVRDIVESNHDSQHSVHCHPLLYVTYEELERHT